MPMMSKEEQDRLQIMEQHRRYMDWKYEIERRREQDRYDRFPAIMRADQCPFSWSLIGPDMDGITRLQIWVGSGKERLILYNGVFPVTSQALLDHLANLAAEALKDDGSL